MNVFYRVILAAKHSGLKQFNIAKYLGVSPGSFSQWQKGDSQKNLYPHLPKILGYCLTCGAGEGEMLRGASDAVPGVQEIDKLRTELTEVKGELTEANWALRRQVLGGQVLGGHGACAG